MSEERLPYSIEEARAFLEAERTERAAQCGAEIENLLKRYHSVLRAVISVDGREVDVPVRLVAL